MPRPVPCDVRLPASLHARIQRYARAHALTIEEVVDEFLTFLLDFLHEDSTPEHWAFEEATSARMPPLEMGGIQIHESRRIRGNGEW